MAKSNRGFEIILEYHYSNENTYLCRRLVKDMKYIRISISSIVIFYLSVVSALAQCAMCKGQLESTSESHVGMAVNDGILYLLALPFLLALTVGGLIWFQVRKQKRQMATES